MAKKTQPQTGGKKLPIIDTSTRALTVAAPFDFITGRRTKNVPYALMADFQDAQAEVMRTAPSAAQRAALQQTQERAAAADATDADRAAHQQALADMQAIQTIHKGVVMCAFKLGARLVNAAIVAWNLDEYERLDGQCFNPAGAIDANDLLYMPTELMQAVIAAVMQGDGAAEKKSDAPSTAS